MSTAPISQQEPQLQLTQLESRIFRLVLEACKQYQLNTQVRVAGGWVRDKLLGLESDDIDFALDNMSGEEFANKLSEYLKSIGEKTSSIGVIKVSTDMKHSLKRHVSVTSPHSFHFLSLFLLLFDLLSIR